MTQFAASRVAVVGRARGRVRSRAGAMEVARGRRFRTSCRNRARGMSLPASDELAASPRSTGPACYEKNMDKLCLESMSDDRLLERVEGIVARSNQLTAELLPYLA